MPIVDTATVHAPEESFGPVAFCGQVFERDVTRVECADEGVTDLTPLASLTKLVWLKACAPPIADLTPLAGLTALESLDLCGHGRNSACRLDGVEGDPALLDPGH